MNTKLFAGVMVILLVLFPILEAQGQDEELIINPTIGGYGSMPVGGARILNKYEKHNDTLKVKEPEQVYGIPSPEQRDEWPGGILIKGKAPNIGKSWAVAVTKDEEEFLQALPEFKRLMAEGRYMEARQVLHISTSINVATRVEEFSGKEKQRDVPENIGRFWFMLPTDEYLKYGGHLTFLSFTPDPDNPMIGIGRDIGEKIHGKLMITTTEGNQYFKHHFAMEIVKASIVHPSD